MAKKVTLPVGNKLIFDALADIAYQYESHKPKDAKAFKEDVCNELGAEAFLFSFTPSGEIGDNPQTPRIAETFYDSFPEIFSPKSGVVAINMTGESKAKVNNAIFRVKSSTVNLIQVYLETTMGLKTRNKEKSGNTSFDYPKLSGKKTPAEYKLLLEVEKNRYMRLFIAAIFTKTIGTLLALSPSDLRKAIKDFDMWNINNVTDSKQAFAILRKPENRRNFVESVKEMWKLELTNKNKTKKK